MGTATDLGASLQDVTPYGDRQKERRQGERRQQLDRRLGREHSLTMRVFRFIRCHMYHLPEYERHLPDRRKADRRLQDIGDHHDQEDRLLSQEEIQFLLRGGFA